MDNFKFTSLLAVTSFSEEERRNFTVIFNTLTDERKIQIMEWWPKYLDRILSIKQKAKSEREKIIREGFEKIHKMMNDAYLREQEEKGKKEQQSKAQEEIDRNVDWYNRQKRLDEIRALERASEKPIQGIRDPLAGIATEEAEANIINFPM